MVVLDLEYKKAIKAAKAEYDSRANYDLHDHLASLECDTFWKVWINVFSTANLYRELHDIPHCHHLNHEPPPLSPPPLPSLAPSGWS